MLVKVEELTADLSQVRLFHTSVTPRHRHLADWPGEPGFTGDFAEYVAQKFPTSTAADFAILEAGIVSEETYVEQGLYWETGHHPLIKYILKHVPARPGHGRLSRPPTSSSTSSSGSSRRSCPTAHPTRPTTTCRSTARPTAAWPQREAFIRARLPGRRRDAGAGADR